MGLNPFSSGNKYGLCYVLVRIVLGIVIGVMLISAILSILNNGIFSYSLNGYVWLIISIVSLGIGFLGVWREHFFAIFLLCVGSLTMLWLSNYERIYVGIWSNSYAGTQDMMMAMVGLSALFAFMLYTTGHQEMGLPDF